MKKFVLIGVVIAMCSGGIMQEAAAAYSEWILGAWPVYWGTTVTEVGRCPRKEDGRPGRFLKGRAWWAAGSYQESITSGVELQSGPKRNGTGYRATITNFAVYAPNPTYHLPVVLYMEIKCRYDEAYSKQEVFEDQEEQAIADEILEDLEKE